MSVYRYFINTGWIIFYVVLVKPQKLRSLTKIIEAIIPNASRCISAKLIRFASIGSTDYSFSLANSTTLGFRASFASPTCYTPQRLSLLDKLVDYIRGQIMVLFQGQC